jgi:hypothetical protein
LSESFAKRMAKVEARINALRSKQTMQIIVKDFSQPAPAADDPVADSTRRTSWPCPAEDCAGMVAHGVERCRHCGAELVWPTPPTT